jgi:hypothetical protein
MENVKKVEPTMVPPLEKDTVRLFEIESDSSKRTREWRTKPLLRLVCGLAFVSLTAAIITVLGERGHVMVESPSWMTSPYKFPTYLNVNDSGLDSLHRPSNVSEDGKVISHKMTYAHPNGVQNVILEYTATLTDDYIIALDYDTNIASVICHSNMLELVFVSSNIAAQTAAMVDTTTLIAGSHHWNCSRSQLTGEADLGERSSSLLLKVVVLERVRAERLFLRVEPARHEHFFKALNLTFKTNMVPTVASNHAPSRASGSRALARREMFGFISKAFSAVGHAIASVAKAAWHGVCTVAKDVVNVVKVKRETLFRWLPSVPSPFTRLPLVSCLSSLV